MRNVLRNALPFLIVLSTQNAYAGEFAVSPMLITIESAPRKTETIEFIVEAKKAGKVRIFLSDLEQQETGHMGFMQFTNDYEGTAGWVDLDTDTVELDAGERATVTGKVRIPKNAKGAHLAAIMVEEVNPPAKSGFGVSVRYAIMLDIKLSGKKTRLFSKFSDLAFEEQDGDTFVVAWFENLSDRDEFFQSEVQIRDSRRRLAGRVALKTLSAWQRGDESSRVFSGSKVRVYGRLNKFIKEGDYELTVRNRFGGVPLLKVRENLVFEPKAGVAALDEIEWANYQVPAITIKPKPSGIAISQFELENPYGETIEIVFPKESSNSTADVSFYPNKIQLKPGDKTKVRLVQRWQGKEPRGEAYESKLISGKHSQSFQIVTVL